MAAGRRRQAVRPVVAAAVGSSSSSPTALSFSGRNPRAGCGKLREPLHARKVDEPELKVESGTLRKQP